MKNLFFSLLLTSFIGSSCGSGLHKVLDRFDSKTPHEKYEEKLDDKGLDETPEVKAWKASSEKALQSPQAVQLPYSQQGYFPLDKPRALGLQFSAKAGEKLLFTLTKKAGNNFVLYADIFKLNGTATSHLLAADTSNTQFSFDVAESGAYILRLQPELFRTGEYNLSVSVGPSLGFPVSGKKANVGSIWGDDRDGGKRSHEGIDVFAPKLTPAVAAADGYIVGVREGGLGGKQVWLRPEGKDYTLYYAHLDRQLVQEGQHVKTGDVVGLVGNTGNARYTPSHLHFGVYTFGGAVDPLPFVNRTIKTASAVTSKNLTAGLKLLKSHKVNNGELIKANTVLVPLAATNSNYIAELPDGRMIQVPSASVKTITVKPPGDVAIALVTGSKKS